MAKIYTVNGEIVESFLNHNHDVDAEKTDRQKVSNSLKRRAIEDITEKPSKQIHMEFKKNPDLKMTWEDVNCIKRNLYNYKRSKLPPLPKNIKDVHDALDALKIHTLKGENFLLKNDRASNIIIFSNVSNLSFMCQASLVNPLYLDGTFQYCPQFSYQLVTIHCFVNNYYVPVIYSLLPNKRLETYNILFQTILEQCSSFSLIFKPSMFIIDFEKAIHTSLNTVFPNSTVKGCLFHLTQAWYRKIVNLGLSSVYEDVQSEESKWLHYIFGLPYLNPEDVGNCFYEDFMAIIPNQENIIQFADYIVETYIAEDSIYPPYIWAQATSSMSRTTNACESFHNHFANSFYKSHPNIFSFCEVLIEFQSLAECKIHSSIRGQKLNRTCIRRKQIYIEKTIDDCKNQVLCKFDMVKKLCGKFNK